MTSIDANPKVKDRGCLEITGTKGTYIMDGGWYKIILPGKGGVTTTKQGKNPPSEGWKFYQNVADHMVKGKDLVITGEGDQWPDTDTAGAPIPFFRNDQAE